MMSSNQGKEVPVEYEIRLRQDSELSLRETSEYFGSGGALLATLRQLTKILATESISYAVLGALALREYGFVRATVDIDLLLTPEAGEEFQQKIVGRGFRPAFPGARKQFRSTETGVRIDVLFTGEYPGDGKPKPVSFPDPSEAFFERNGIRYITLEKLIELKLASGISAEHRLRDLADVQDLIRETKLPLELSESLHESVRHAYLDLWKKAQIRDPLQE